MEQRVTYQTTSDESDHPDTVTIPRSDYEQMQAELRELRRRVRPLGERAGHPRDNPFLDRCK